jgi:monofunctional glycosyltransferase
LDAGAKNYLMARAIFIFLSGFALLAATLSWLMVSMPNPQQITGCMVTEMYRVSLCEKNASYARTNQISQYVKDVIVISEDSSFYYHKGFDWFEIKNSMRENWADLSYSRGGSTITQQLAKNVFLSHEKTITRKIREAYLAFQIEQLLTKPKILEKYLNVVEFGNNIFGIRPAAQHYFNKSPDQLNLLEAAYLAYLLPNPKMYSRVYYKGALTDFSRFRILDLCYKMYRYGRISEDQYNAAKEYVSLFPWKGMDGVQLARLSGAGGMNPDELIPQNAMSDNDSKIAAPVPSDKMLEEIKSLSEEQPFDNPTVMPPHEVENATVNAEGAAANSEGASTSQPIEQTPAVESEDTFDN